MRIAAAVAICCAAGGLARYYISGWLHHLFGRGFPFGTLTVNVVGALLIGMVMQYSLRGTLPESVRVGLVTGLLGGLTTFSSFSYETLYLLRDGRLLSAFVNIVANLLLCLLFTWFGMVAVRNLL